MAASKPFVLESKAERTLFIEGLAGKRVLMVKGFGSSFKDPTADQEALGKSQTDEAIGALGEFNPDFIVVDGDNFGSGFQQYIKIFVDKRLADGKAAPELVWVKDVKEFAADGEGPVEKEKEKRLKQAGGWAEQGMSVTVFWISTKEVEAKMNELFGSDAVEKLAAGDYNTRGIVKVLSDQPQAWVEGVDKTIKAGIEAIESRPEQQFFEKCSFENCAKGNVIFDVLHNPKCNVHGTVTFGGGESVLLEFATKYLNRRVRFPKRNAAIFPFSRGRDDTDPKLPKIVGSAFTGNQITLKKPKFNKVQDVKPEKKGLNLMMKVVKVEEDAAATKKTWEVVAGDASGVVTLRLTSENHVEVCKAGASIRVQNAFVIMYKSFIRIVIDKWGVLKGADEAVDFEPNLKADVSAVEYELK